METTILKDYRCDCGKLLLRGMLLTCQIEIKCKRCGMIKVLNGILENSRAPGRYALLLDRSGRIAQSDSAASTALSYSQSELLARNIYHLDPLLRPSIYKKLWDTTRSEHDSFALETVQRKKDGSILSVKIRLRFLSMKGEKYALMNVDTSHTLHKEMPSDSQTESTTHFQDQFSAEINTQGILTYVYGIVTHLCGITNLSETKNFLGYTPSEMLGKPITDFLSTEQKEFYIKELAKHSALRQPFQIPQITAQHKQGHPVQFKSHFTPRLSDNDLFKGYISTHLLTQP